MQQLLTIGKLGNIIFILFFFVSCVEGIDLEKEREKKIVVNCILTNDSIQTLKLTYSNPINQYYYDEVGVATITLYLDSILVGQFEKIAYSKWEIKHQPQAGAKYRLKILVPGWPEIEAQTIMPETVWVEKQDGSNSEIKQFFKHQNLSSPFWMFALRQFQDTIMIEPTVLTGDKLQNSIGTNHPSRDDFNTTDKIVLDNKGTTREHMAYIRVNPTNKNIDNEISFFLEGALYTSLVFFRSASTEYDDYLKSSVQKMMVYDTFDDPTQWFDENEVYTNITNGLGIFGAYSDRIIQCHYSLSNYEIKEL